MKKQKKELSYGNYPDISSVRKVLIIKLRHLGDVLLTSPVFSYLKKAAPQVEIDAYVYREAYPMLEGHTAIRDIITYDREWKKLSFFSRMRKEIAILQQIHKKKYDLVINLTEGDRGAIAAKASHAKIIVGIDPGKSGMKGKKKIYSHLVKNCPSPRHAVEKNLDSLRRIGLFPKEEEKKIFFYIPQKIKEKMEKFLLEKEFSKGFILIHPTSRWRFKCWQNKKWEACAKKLTEKGEKIIFTAGKEFFEKQMVQEITKNLPKESFLDLSGKVTVKELGALIEKSKILLTVDSVPFHIASALSSFSLALFGPTSEKNWGPWKNKKGKAIYLDIPCRPCMLDGCGGSKVSDCLSSFPEKKVLEEIEELFYKYL